MAASAAVVVVEAVAVGTVGQTVAAVAVVV